MPPIAGQHPFDLQYGVDTGRFVMPEMLAAADRADCGIGSYRGVEPSIVRHCLDRLPVPHRFTFVDIGCGKGRVALIASEYAFRRVIGVEISTRLAQVALRNTCLIAQRYPERPGIEIALGDATCFPLPGGPLVLFLHTPLSESDFRHFAERVAEDWDARPRRILLISIGRWLAGLLEHVADFRRLASARIRVAPAERPFASEGWEWVAFWECLAGAT